MNWDAMSGQTLSWVQPRALRRFFQLVSGEREIAGLRFRSRSLAVGKYGESEWTFQRTGFWAKQVVVRETGSDADVAVFRPNWRNNGFVEFASGARYEVKHSGFWQSTWTAKTQEGKSVLTLQGPGGFVRQRGSVQVLETADASEVAVLVLLVWYVAVKAREDAAAAGAVAASASAH